MQTGPALAALMALAAPGAAAAQAGPSFDCADAGTASERAICASPALSRLERRMVEGYEALAARIGRADARRAADVFLARRQACGADPPCIERELLSAMAGFIALGTPGLVDGAALDPPPEPDPEIAPEPDPGPDTGPDPGPAPAPDPEPASPAARAFAAMPDWRRRNAMTRLAQAGYDPGPADGGWTAASEAALHALVADAAAAGADLGLGTEGDARAALRFLESDAFARAYLPADAPPLARW